MEGPPFFITGALLDLLAFIAGNAVNAVQAKADRPGNARLSHGDALARAMSFDMTAWFQPTAEAYFGRIAKGHILAAIDEAKGAHAPGLDKLKKAELAVRVEALIAQTGWLPVPLRVAAEADASADQEVPEAAE